MNHLNVCRPRASRLDAPPCLPAGRQVGGEESRPCNHVYISRKPRPVGGELHLLKEHPSSFVRGNRNKFKGTHIQKQLNMGLAISKETLDVQETFHEAYGAPRASPLSHSMVPVGRHPSTKTGRSVRGVSCYRDKATFHPVVSCNIQYSTFSGSFMSF